jgi:hypothetical protein
MIRIAVYENTESGEDLSVMVEASCNTGTIYTLLTADEARDMAGFLMDRANAIDPMAVN